MSKPMKRFIISFAALIAMTGSVLAQPLSSYRWEQRPLLIFAPSETAPEFLRQQDVLTAARSGLNGRDMAVLLVTGTGGLPESLAGPSPAAAATKAALRKAYRVSEEEFAVILVGKDGGEKGRWTDPVDPTEIFGRVDAMPMRAREMRQGG